MIATQFCKRNIAFCRWNTRGCSLSNTPPEFVSINIQEFATYCSSSSIQDILTIRNFIKTLPQFKHSKILFMGISEGATLVPFVMTQCCDVEGLLLLGFSYENMKQTLEWQLNGGSSMVNMCKYFDCTKKGFVEKSGFIRDQYHVRSSLFQNIEFEALDIDKDGILAQHHL